MSKADRDASTATTLDQRRRARLRGAFVREQQAGLHLATWGRLIALAIIALWLLWLRRDIAVVWPVGFLVVFAGFAVAQLRLAAGRHDRAWLKYVFAGVETALLAAILVAPNPLDPAAAHIPSALRLRGTGFSFYFLFLSIGALSLSPWFVLWIGATAAASWSAAVLWAIAAPGTTTAAVHNFDDPLGRLLDPNFVDVGIWYQQVILLLVVAALLALAVSRARLLVARQAIAERERANLARYFSPNLVDELASADNPVAAVRRQDVAVLFTDVVGFTAIAAHEVPERVIALLRDLYARLEAVIFRHRGTIDTYSGDSLMATFGTPHVGSDDATRALRCGRDILTTLDEWNRERSAQGEVAILVGIGIHCGPVVLGNIGGERRLEFTAIGDTVNVASRIEALTREAGSDLIVSGALVDAVRRENPAAAEAELAGLVAAPPAMLRGRDTPTDLWMLKPEDAGDAPRATA